MDGAMVRRPKGSSNALSRIDDAPEMMEELIEYFAAMDKGSLSGCWVGCVVAAAMQPHSAGDLARCLNVVAVKLDLSTKGIT